MLSSKERDTRLPGPIEPKAAPATFTSLLRVHKTFLLQVAVRLEPVVTFHLPVLVVDHFTPFRRKRDSPVPGT